MSHKYYYDKNILTSTVYHYLHGLGKILVQITKAITGATIIATASRKSSQAWVKKSGAHHEVVHTKSLELQVEALGIG